jgi:hypothetical protein
MNESIPQGTSNLIRQSENSELDTSLAAIEGQLGRDPSTDREFIDLRCAELSKGSDARIGGISHMGHSLHDGYIYPETTIVRSFLVDPLRIDDPDIYTSLLRVFREFKSSEGWQNLPIRSYYLNAIQYTVGRYFGNFVGDSHTENRNRSMYTDHTESESPAISVSEFKGKQSAVCAEKAPVAQNLLVFSGATSRLVASSTCKIPADAEPSAHYFNIVSTDKGHFIFDPTNPSVLLGADKRIESVAPSVHKISNAQFISLISGGEVEVTHLEGARDSVGQIEKTEQKWIYAGPSNRN